MAEITEEHLTPFFESGFDDDELVTYLSSSTVLLNTAFNFGEPVAISYTSTVVFTQDSFVPRESDVEDLINAAFSGNSLNAYLGTLTSLSISNLFSTTTQVSLTTGETENRSTGSSFRSNVLIGAGAGGGVAALAIAALVLSGRRRKKEQVRRKSLGADGHMTVGGDTTFDSRSINERTEDSRALEEVNLD